MADSYVCNGAIMKCNFGTSTAKLYVNPDRTIFLTGQPQANISDHKSKYNIHPFGRCRTVAYPLTCSATDAHHGHLTPMPCQPGTFSNWMNGKDDYILKGSSALLKSSYCRCCYGGIITFVTDGQTDTGQADLSKENIETEKQWNAQQEQLTPEEILDGIQLALDAAGFVPGLGAIPDLLNAAISALRGDWPNAGLSLLAAVPGVGDAAAAVKLANKGAKMAKAAKTTEKATKTTEKVAATVGKSTDNVASLAEKRAAKTEKLINESDNVTRFPSKTANSTQSTGIVAKGKSENVVHIDKYERKVEKQVNGPDNVTVTKKTDTVVDSIDNHRKVEKVYPSTQTGSSTSYGARQGGEYRSSSNGNWKENRIKVLKDKKSRRTISASEEAELKQLDPNSGSIFD